MWLGVSPRPGRIYPRKRPGTHYTGGWVGHKAGQDKCGKSRPAGIRSPGSPARNSVAIPPELPAHNIICYCSKIFSYSLFQQSHPHCVYQITKYQIYIDIQSEHNYAILSSSIQSIDYMFRPLLGHHQVVLNLQSNCTLQSATSSLLVINQCATVPTRSPLRHTEARRYNRLQQGVNIMISLADQNIVYGQKIRILTSFDMLGFLHTGYS